MSYMSDRNYNQLKTDHFILGEGGSYNGDLLVLEGNLTAKRGSCFMSELKMIPNECIVVLEESSVIGHLHFMNGGHLYLKGKCVICKFLVEGPVTLHVSKSLPNWKVCFECCDDAVDEEDFKAIIIED